MSIKFRVTVCYSLLVIFICGILVGTIAIFNDKITSNAIYELIEDEVGQKVTQLEYDASITLRAEDVYINNGVYIQIYNKEGKMLAGTLPSGFFSRLKPLGDGVITTRDENDAYMSHCRVTEDGEYIVRGLVSKKNMGILEETVMKITIYMTPLIVLMAFLGGKVIARWAFSPFDKINAAIKEVSSGKDLSKRLDVPDNRNDEMSEVSRSFNNMLGRLEEAFESEKQFISDASHELRTPVSVILAQCQWARMKSGSGDDMQTLDLIERQAKRMSSLISRLLMLTRMDRGIEKPDPIPMDISELVAGLCDAIEESSPEVEIEKEIEPGLEACINFVCLSSAYENLLTNAVRYGGGKIKVRLRRIADEIVFSVADNGIGIVPEEKDKIWNRFYRGKNVLSHEGMGLGLSFVKDAAKLHNGRVGVESEPGKETVFELVIKCNGSDDDK